MREKVTLAMTVLIFAASVFADVPPPPGQTYVPVSLLVEVAEDFPEHRFFLDSPDEVEEIAVKKDSPVTINGEGRDGVKRFGNLIAIPKKSLPGLGANPSDEQMESLDESLSQNKIEGVIKLFNHHFRGEVREAEKDKLVVRTVIIEKDAEKGLKAVTTSPVNTASSGNNRGGIDFSLYGLAKSFTIPGWIVLIGIGLFVTAIIILGVWLFRRKRQ